jgi:hypothetical protein
MEDEYVCVECNEAVPAETVPPMECEKEYFGEDGEPTKCGGDLVPQ